MSGSSELIERFLGPQAATGDLHSLLGIRVGAPTVDEVIGGLERRLMAVEDHPQGRTPEADEVRLALHAAAAQLIDRSARAAGAARAAAGRASAQALKRQLEHDAIITLARYGGWNRRSLRRLAMLAVARGARPGDVARVLTHLAHRRRGVASVATPGRRPRMPGVGAEPLSHELISSLPSPGEAAPAPAPEFDSRPLIILVGAIATLITLLVAVSLVIIALTAGERKPSAPGPETAAPPPRVTADDLPMAGGAEVFPWQGGGAPGEAPAEAEEREKFENLAEALAALDSAPEGLAVEPTEAVELFGDAFGSVGARWCNLTLAQQRAAQHDVVEFVYRVVQRPELSERVIGLIAAGGEVLARSQGAIVTGEVWPAAWSVGMLARLAREQDLGAVATRAVEARLREQIGSPVAVTGGFEQGVQAALWAMLPGLVRPADADTEISGLWEAWIDAARFGQDDAQKTVLSALEWVLIVAEEPGESETVRSAIESLTLGCDWGEGAAARPWLIRMFADTRVSNADLHALTTVLSRRSRAPGVDATMALAVRSTAEGRDLLRERYAGAWGLDVDGPTLDDLASDWLKAAREAGAMASASTTTVERLAAAACLSRLSEAARLRYAGRLDDAGIVIDEFDRLVEIELTTWSQKQSADTLGAEPGMSRWALDYLSAQRDFSERLRLLNSLRQQQVREAVDAEVLVLEAVRGSPVQARAAAREALLAQRPSAVLTLAMLEAVPRMPRTPQNSELVSAVTSTLTLPVDDPDWRLKLRRVLVQTALEQLAAEGDQGVIDGLASLLGESYAARAVGEVSGTGSAAVPGTAPDEAAAMVRVQWERLARQGGLGSGAIEVESVLARHASRLGLSQGPVQVFSAEQMAAFELMAIAIAAERLERAGDVQAIQDRVREQRRGAGDVITQILVVERAFVDLWAVRLGQEVP